MSMTNDRTEPTAADGDRGQHKEPMNDQNVTTKQEQPAALCSSALLASVVGVAAQNGIPTMAMLHMKKEWRDWNELRRWIAIYLRTTFQTYNAVLIIERGDKVTVLRIDEARAGRWERAPVGHQCQE